MKFRMKASLLHFFVLLAIILIGVISFRGAVGNTGLQFFIGVVTTIAYVIWGILHHALKGDLHKKVVVEYILIGAIAILLLEVTVGP